MRRRFPIASTLVLASVSIFQPFTAVLAQTTTPGVAERALFDWAEYAYPKFFAPAGAATQLTQGYFTRYYSGSNTYLGVRDQTVYAAGSPFINFTNIGNGIRRLGTFDAFSNSMRADGYGVYSGEKLLISEAVAKDSKGGADWFELYNAGSLPVSLAGYQVKDDAVDRVLQSLPSVVLAPGEYLAVTASETAVSGSAPRVAFNLGDSDSVQLYKQGVLMDALAWDNDEAEHGYSFGHYPAPLSKAKSITPTPAAANKSDAGWTRSVLGSVGTLKSGVVHTVAVTIDQAAFVKMVETYRASRTKDWIEGTVTIDGTTYKQVGLRLKGNSSLMSVTTSSDPASVPWLVKLDKYDKSQNHEGMEEFVIRSNNSRSAINEAVSLELLELAGLASQDAIEARLSVNGGTPRLRLVVESPDGEWMAEEFADTGALYKAEATGDYSYRGDDPASYKEVFDQEAGDDNADLTPLIAFLKFINQSSDGEFTAGLASRFDIDAFASYLAMNELLNNFDDIDGPGNNSYLYYDTVAKKFTIVPWDYNLAFGTNVGGGGGAGGGFPGGGGGVPGGGGIPGGGGFPGGGGVPPTRPDGVVPTVPGGGIPTLPDGVIPTLPDGAIPTLPGGGGAAGGGFGNRSNILVQRFTANSQWNALYQQKLATLKTKLYASGIANELLKLWSGIVTESGLVDAATLTAEQSAISRYFN